MQKYAQINKHVLGMNQSAGLIYAKKVIVSV